MAVVIVLVLTNTKFCFHLSDISGVNLEAVFVRNILLNIIIVVSSACVRFQISGVNSDMQIVADLFPT